MAIEEVINTFAANYEEWRQQILIKYFPDKKSEKVLIVYGKVYAKLIIEFNNGQQSAYALIAMNDGFNKTVGLYKKGDIFKAATWSSPAKHVRGNIFDENPIRYMKVYGVKNLM